MSPRAPSQAHHPLAAVLSRVEPSSCPERFNFHCHTTCSDGSLTPAGLARQALALGLEHLAVTDHHALEAHPEIAAVFDEAAADGRPAPVLWRGVEISCLLEGCLVHVLALGFSERHDTLRPYLRGRAVVGSELRAEAVLEAIHGAGGLALLAHPARYRRSFRHLLAAAADLGFDGAEAWYDYELQARWSPTPLVCEAIAKDLGQRGLLMSCGTDTHGLNLRGR